MPLAASLPPTATLTVIATLALGGGDGTHDHAGANAARAVRATCDGPERDLGIRWEASLAAAMERGRREKKPVLGTVSARRQDTDFTTEY